jgi:hypothetical protein
MDPTERRLHAIYRVVLVIFTVVVVVGLLAVALGLTPR